MKRQSFVKKPKEDFAKILDGAADRFRERGIRFCLATSEDEDRVWKFMMESFIPDEPVLRSMDFLKEDTMINRSIIKELRRDFMTKCVNADNAYSIIAEDSVGQVMGIKLGFAMSRDERLGNIFYYPAMKYFYWLLPRRMVDLNVIGWHLEEVLEYHPNKTMESMNVSSLFEGEILGVSDKARGLGLGKEMVRMSIEIGRQLGCEIYSACVTGIYSQKIFRDLGFTVTKELIYEDVKDKNGKTLLNDTREHKKAQMVYLKL